MRPMESTNDAQPNITGLILAGGQGSRMDGRDKGLENYRGRPLVEWAMERLQSQVNSLIISANRHQERYAAYGHPLVSDDLPDYPGPLAGLHAGLEACATPLLACIPCDTPHFPSDLVERLHAAMTQASAPAAWACTNEGEHPVFLLCQKALAADLQSYLQQGERRVRGWLHRVGGVPVRFPNEKAFANFNTLEALAKASEGEA